MPPAEIVPTAPSAQTAAALARARLLIDRVDDALLVLFALRRRLATHAGACKRAAARPLADPVRERRVHRRAQGLARRLGLPPESAHALAALAIADARRGQGLAPDPDSEPVRDADHHGRDDFVNQPDLDFVNEPDTAPWLRVVPPPARWAALLRACPVTLQRRLLEAAMRSVLERPLGAGQLDFLQGRRLGIDVVDLGLTWVVTLDGDRLRAIDAAAEATVHGTATDLLLLAGRLEDADTLFFQRRLLLAGDTELGLTARNLLDRLPWDEVPLALRIFLNRGARFAQAARAARRA